jgi:hypothetical protein
MLPLIIILLVILVLFGGVGYGYRGRMGPRYYGGGVGVLGTILIIVLLLWALGAIKL